MVEPLVSLILPVYNAAPFLRATLDSVLGQTYSRLEVIIVNDGSTDKSDVIIQSYTDHRIRYFFQENKGQCAAANRGLSNAKGEYIKFFDADDIMNPGHIGAQVKRLEGNISAIASSAWGRFYNGDPSSTIFKPEAVWKDMKPLDWLITALSQPSDMMGACLWLLPKILLEKTGGWDERLSLNNDFEFSIRLLLNASDVLFVPEAKTFYRSGVETSLNSSKSEKAYRAAYLSTQLGCSYLMAADKSEKMKKICANRYQLWIHRIYPLYPQLTKEMEAEIVKLGGSDLVIDAGGILKTLSKVLGWKKAKKLKQFFYNLGYKPVNKYSPK